MRLNRNTLILIVVLVVILAGAAVLLNQPEGGDSAVTTATAEQVALFPDVSPDDITTLTITEIIQPVLLPDATEEPDGEPEAVTSTVVLVRSEGSSWALDTENSDIEAGGELEQTDIASVVTTLASLQSSQQFTRDDLAPFGLDGTVRTVEFVAGDETYTLRVGTRNPQSTRFYAQLGDDETIYLVSNPAQIDTLVSFADVLPVVELPTPTAVPVLTLPGNLYPGSTQGDFLGFTMTNNETGETLAFERETVDSDWVLADAPEGVDGVADQSGVNLLVTAWVSLSGVDTLPAENLDNLGLEEPAFTLVGDLRVGGTSTLQIGGQDPSGSRYYTLVNEFEEVAVVPASELELVLSQYDNPPLTAPVGPSVPDSTEAADAQAEATETESESAEAETEEADMDSEMEASEAETEEADMESDMEEAEAETEETDTETATEEPEATAESSD